MFVFCYLLDDLVHPFDYVARELPSKWTLELAVFAKKIDMFLTGANGACVRAAVRFTLS